MKESQRIACEIRFVEQKNGNDASIADSRSATLEIEAAANRDRRDSRAQTAAFSAAGKGLPLRAPENPKNPVSNRGG